MFVSMGIFGCLLFIIVQYNRLLSNELDYQLWDIQTVTLNDYSVELKIKKNFWREFELHNWEERVNSPLIGSEIPTLNESFRKYLREYIIKSVDVVKD